MKKNGSLILKKRVGLYFQLEIKFKYHFWSKTLPDFVYLILSDFSQSEEFSIQKNLRFEDF